MIINHFINHLTTLIFCFVKSIQFTYTVLRRFRMVGSTFVLLRRRLPRLHSSKIAFVRTNNSVYYRYVETTRTTKWNTTLYSNVNTYKRKGRCIAYFAASQSRSYFHFLWGAAPPRKNIGVNSIRGSWR